MKTNQRKKQSGQILIFVIFVVLFLMLFVSLFISKILTKQAKTADNVMSSVQAFYMADTGAEYTLRAFRDCEADRLPGCLTDNKPDEGDIVRGGNFTIFYNSTNSKIDITGTYKGQTSRAIELSWSN